MGFVLISYDISDDGNRSKVANILSDYGTRVQYSVFESRVDLKTLEKLIEKLKDFPERDDSIRIYQICDACIKKAVLLGNGEFFEEVAFHIV